MEEKAKKVFIGNNIEVMIAEEQKAIVIAGFPGVGKSYFFKNGKAITKLKIYDSDSSKYDKSLFPQNYVAELKQLLNKKAIILVSTHKEFIDMMISEGIKFYIVYPQKNLHDEYMNRYIKRNSSIGLITTIHENWDKWIDDCHNLNIPKTRKIMFTNKDDFLNSYLENNL